MDTVEDLAAAAIGGGDDGEKKDTEEEVDANAKFFEVVDDDAEFLQDMTLIGILGLEDGVRPEVIACSRLTCCAFVIACVPSLYVCALLLFVVLIPTSVSFTHCNL